MIETETAPVLVHVSPGDGETIDVLGDAVTFKVTTALSGGGLIVGEVTTAPGGGPPLLHTHPPHEAFYVLEGEFEWRGVNADGPFTVRATPGSVVYVPPGAPHTFTNVGSTPGRMLGIYTEAAMEAFPRALAAATAGSSPDNPPDPAVLAPVFDAYQIAFITE